MRYFFGELEFRGWYMIPEELNGKWWYNRTITNVHRRLDLIDQDFSKYKIDHPSSYLVTDPIKKEE